MKTIVFYFFSCLFISLAALGAGIREDVPAKPKFNLPTLEELRLYGLEKLKEDPELTEKIMIASIGSQRISCYWRDMGEIKFQVIEKDKNDGEMVSQFLKIVPAHIRIIHIMDSLSAKSFSIIFEKP